MSKNKRVKLCLFKCIVWLLKRTDSKWVHNKNTQTEKEKKRQKSQKEASYNDDRSETKKYHKLQMAMDDVDPWIVERGP